MALATFCRPLRITPLGNVELLSTHDQVLGGPNGQTFLGSQFPADPAYVSKISRQAEAVGLGIRTRSK